MVVRLAVSGIEVEIRPPGGAEDLLLAESAEPDHRLAISLAGAVGRAAGDGATIDWERIPEADLDAVVLHARSMVFGETVRATATCPRPDCGARITVAFSVTDYVRYHRPTRPPGVEPDQRPGWYRLMGSEIRFRVPTAGDVATARRAVDPAAALAAACIEPSGLHAQSRRRAERALARLSPSLVDEVAGVCPDCGAGITMWFDPIDYCLRELRDQAAAIHDDVHVLASTYHWSEEQILALPRGRRVRYAEMARDERRLAS